MARKRVTILLVLVIAAVLAGCAPKQEMGQTAALPAGRAYAEGREIYFVHTEVSDPNVAQLLTEMMDSPVLHVPSLADTPDNALANVYVFTNGLKGMGPLGFAADVFDNPPGAEGYTPLLTYFSPGANTWINYSSLSSPD